MPTILFSQRLLIRSGNWDAQPNIKAQAISRLITANSQAIACVASARICFITARSCTTSICRSFRVTLAIRLDNPIIELVETTIGSLAIFPLVPTSFAVQLSKVGTRKSTR